MKFDLTTQSFSPVNCAACVQAAALAYPQSGESNPAWQARVKRALNTPLSIPPVAESLLPQADEIFDVVEFLNAPATDTQGFMAANDELVVIAFRGSSSVRDWITDLDARKRELFFLDVEIHEGFAAAYQSVKAEILAFLLAQHGKPIIITGHSLGGALAMLCAFDVHGLAHLHNVYTFGQPRCGDARFAECYNAELQLLTFRLVNNLDIVPRLPGALLGFRHAGTEVFLDALGESHFDLAWWQKLPSDALAIYEDWTRHRVEAVQDHFIAQYQNLVGHPANIPARTPIIRPATGVPA